VRRGCASESSKQRTSFAQQQNVVAGVLEVSGQNKTAACAAVLLVLCFCKQNAAL
jgi:hypothetical protein